MNVSEIPTLENFPIPVIANEGLTGEKTNVIPFPMRKIPVKTDTSRTIKLNAFHIEAALVSYLQALGEIKENEEVSLLDLGLAVDEDDLVAIDIDAFVIE